MKFRRLTRFLPSLKNAALAILSAVLLVLSFPDFEFWYLAWFGLVPLFVAIDRERESPVHSLILGLLWGVVFFTGTCWWLTFAPITYAGFPWAVAYFLLFVLTVIVGIFPALFALIVSVLVRRFGKSAFLAAPLVWVCSEFLRYWVTGNNWNSLGHSQAFNFAFLFWPTVAGAASVSFIVALINAVWYFSFRSIFPEREVNLVRAGLFASVITLPFAGFFFLFSYDYWVAASPEASDRSESDQVIAIQPNVPMSGLNFEKWKEYRRKHVELAESALRSIRQHPQSAIRNQQLTVVFPESPMNFMYEDDQEFRDFVHAFAAKHDVQILFNSAEPDGPNNKYFNSAVLVGPEGKEVAQYDKIYLVPFGESVPAPLQSIVPAFVGSFSYGKEYDLLPLGNAKAGVMICFESHFGELSREYVRNGADAIIEMTNDGYLGPTPILRQHLANAVFRAVETNRPVLRVTNVGVTAYITPNGEILDASEPYTEATRVWSVGKSDGSQTTYVKYGDWFAWLCSLVSLGLLVISLGRRSRQSAPSA